MTIKSSMQNSVILSVNCLFVSASHRLLGHSFFAPFIHFLVLNLTKLHSLIESDANSLTEVKNTINVLIHFYLFGNVSHQCMFGLVKFLMSSFKEKDLEILLNLLHNIGGQLRKESPELILEII